MRSSSVISEIFSPSAPSPPMKRIEMTSAKADGSRVTIGARMERKISSNSTMMKRNERRCVLLPAAFEPFWLATFVATAPARWSSSPGGTPAWGSVA